MSLGTELEIYKDIPGYKGILKAVLKSQIQMLVEQLALQTGEESVVLSASVTEGTLSHLGTESGKDFLRGHEEIKKQFLGFCLTRQQKRKTDDTFSSSHKRFAASSTYGQGGSDTDLPATISEATEMSHRSIPPVKKIPMWKKGTYRQQRPSESFAHASSHYKSSSLGKDKHRKDPFERGDTSSYDELGTFESADKFSKSGSASAGSYSPSQTGYTIPGVDHIPVPVMLQKQSDKVKDSEADSEYDLSSHDPVKVKIEIPDEPDEQTEEDGSSVVKSKDVYLSGLGPESHTSQMGSMEEGNIADTQNQSYDYVLNQGKELESSLSWKDGQEPQTSVPFMSKRKQLLPAKLRKTYIERGPNSDTKGGEDSDSELTVKADPGLGESVYGPDMSRNAVCKDEVDASWRYENTNTPSPSSYGDQIPFSDGAVNYASDNVNAGTPRKPTKFVGKIEKNGYSAPMVDGAFVSRGEGRFEKLIKCELCGKVCRTSNMARHKKRYCLASPSMHGSSKVNLNVGTDAASGVSSMAAGEGYADSSYSYTFSSPTSYS